MTFRTRNTLESALTAGLHARRPALLRYFLKSHGGDAFVPALTARPLRQVADLMSLLTKAEQAAICPRLPPSIKNQLRLLGIPCPSADAAAHPEVACASFEKWLPHFCTAWMSRWQRLSCKNRRLIKDATKRPSNQKNR